jgi:hypothetical protein
LLLTTVAAARRRITVRNIAVLLRIDDDRLVESGRADIVPDQYGAFIFPSKFLIFPDKTRG